MKWMSVLILAALVCSCKKEKTSKTSWVGKWRMVEIDRVSAPGCSCWSQVSPVDAEILELKVSGKYEITKPPFASSIACPGRYRLINDATIGLQAECGGSNPRPEVFGIYSQSTKQLTIVYDYYTAIVVTVRYIKL